ncbi:RHS repeat-associated core domain-containing protein, partial [Cytophagaceae bacterium YF14B1]
KDYYPFGMEMPNRTLDTEKYRYGFNGKEKDEDFDDNYDFGARLYDSRIGRWFKRDFLYSMYPSSSPYNFVDNNPINCIDPDGNLIIFVNGLCNVMGLNVFGLTPGEDYWGTGTISQAEKLLNSKVKLFYDGQLYDYHDQPGDKHRSAVSSAESRFDQGYNYAKEHFKEIITAYEDELKTNPNATIDIVSHSQGGAFSEGLATYLYLNGYQVNTAIHLQSSSSAFIPQYSQAIQTRIALYTREDIVANKYEERYNIADISIYEDNWYGSSDYVYHTVSTSGGTPYTLSYKNENFKYGATGWFNKGNAHGANWHRSAAIFNTIKNALTTLSNIRQSQNNQSNNTSNHNGGPRYKGN